ncbi:hypothetical protein P154DRAFT_31188 [Amniculicola lignicola CBS 123094]|uniref:Uncharacterized protein n=1 Tax=Amniculicola lignicola CBS 123094 TaxID=1392246 RepID=A0A6A5W0I8_9PLEO|nr:hypothetical protein P154DRAFT_31188 [Amniculicola lignicola CBS 123094]
MQSLSIAAPTRLNRRAWRPTTAIDSSADTYFTNPSLRSLEVTRSNSCLRVKYTRTTEGFKWRMLSRWRRCLSMHSIIHHLSQFRSMIGRNIAAVCTKVHLIRAAAVYTALADRCLPSRDPELVRCMQAEGSICRDFLQVALLSAIKNALYRPNLACMHTRLLVTRL